jgi:hypothetical protein
MAIIFDIEVAKTELESYKKQYSELMSIYSYVKDSSLPKQLFPSIEMKMHQIEESIEKQTNLIANYYELKNTLKMIDGYEEEIKEWTKDFV